MQKAWVMEAWSQVWEDGDGKHADNVSHDIKIGDEELELDG